MIFSACFSLYLTDFRGNLLKELSLPELKSRFNSRENNFYEITNQTPNYIILKSSNKFIVVTDQRVSSHRGSFEVFNRTSYSCMKLLLY